MKKVFFIVSFLFSLQFSVHAQSVQVLRKNTSGQTLHAKVEGQSVTLEESGDFLSSYYGLSKSEHLHANKFVKGDLGELHLRFQHYLNDLPVLGSELVAHFKNGALISFNGELYKPSPAVVSLSEGTARAKAIAFVNAERYKWQVPEEEALLKEWMGDSAASYYPSARLTYTPQQLDFDQPFALCYVFDIYAEEPQSRQEIYVHATTGEVWAQEEKIHIIDVTGSANTKYRGNQVITTDSVAPNAYRLRETGRGGGIETYNMQKGTSYAAAVDFTDTDNYWNNYNANFDEVAGDAHFGAEVTYDYFWEKFGRNSFDGNGAKIRSYVHYRNGYSNAFWNGVVMTYGDGNGTSVTPLTSIDVCGHEIAHAVTTNSANLIYSYESGALNESFSDIFGNAIEFYADSTQFNWRIGEDILVSGNGIRNMAAPNTHGDPDTYLGNFWHASATDNGGVHTNSGVQNYWFYLLSVGGTGTNDNGDNFMVDSLGLSKAEAIAYRNLTVYLTRNSQYEDARYFGIQAAIDLYGPCSEEMIATTNAWYAVGVGDEYDSSTVVAEFTADTAYCYGYEQVQFINQSSNAKAYQWNFGDGDTSIQTSPLHQYGQQGVFSVELIAEGCFNNSFDTMYKTSFILIDSTRDICHAVLMPRGGWDTLNLCNTFIYDHSGEKQYTDLVRDTLTLIYDPSDSAHLVFHEFRYETNWDSVYVYDGYDPSAPLLGGFTGMTLPNGGAPLLLTSGAVTITHFSDPYVVDDGFKAELISFRDSLSLSDIPDTTVCYKNALTLTALGSGGYRPDYSYWWNGVQGDSFLTFTPVSDTVIVLKFGDLCLQEYLYDTIVVSVLDSLTLMPVSDTLVCHNQALALTASGHGGDSLNYRFTWYPGLQVADTWRVSFTQDTLVSVVLSDGCTQQTDSTSFWVFVREPILWSQSSDTIICQGGTALLELEILSGGDSTYCLTESVTGSVQCNSTPSPTAALSVAFGQDIVPGTYTHWLTFSDECTAVDDTAFIRVTIRDSLRVLTSNDTSVCKGTSLNISARGTGGVSADYSYDWSNGLSDAPIHLVGPLDQTTVYTVSLSDGCSSFEPIDSIVVTVLDPLNVSIDGPDLLCYNELSSWKAIGSGGTGTYTYLWTPTGDTDSTLSMQLQGQTTLAVTLSDGCTPVAANATFVVDVRPALQIDLPNDTSICIGEQVTLQAQAQGGLASGYSINWDNGLGSGALKVVKPVNTTTYIATLSDNCSEEASDQITVTVNPRPDVRFAASPNPYCTGLPVQFTNTTGLTGNSRFKWTFGDSDSSTEEHPEHSYSLAGNYDVMLKVTNEFNCADSLESQSLMSIVDHPVADFSMNPAQADFFNPDFSFTNRSQFETNYNWSFGDGGGSSSADPKYTYSDTGHYVVTLIASNDLGCPDTVSKIAFVEDVFVLHIPNVFTPNSDGRNEDFGVYARGVVDYKMIIFNRWGEVLWQAEDVNDRWDGTVDGEILDAGVYFYSVLAVDYEGRGVERSGRILIIR